ncbi:sensor domain-containing diguanylate cyclase [Butyrivibrio sp. NC2002]|uniref:sensor domain-containing diguanylate cyclase n=1 Tax=Butyrivibrio sp. NC2002 TaxID=1410610 RepID=UPI000568BDC2|nr:diguanylate cyclase [Butyrivibrio sp. NC2002]
MKSIQSKIMLLTSVAIIMVAVLVGGTGIVTLRQVARYDSAHILNLTADKGASQIDRRLINMEQAVNIVADYASERLFSVDKLVEDENYRNSYSAQLANLFGNVAKNVPGTIAYYVRYNPDIMPPTDGIYYRSQDADGEFYKEKTTDLSKYTREDVDYVNWWYSTIDNGAPTWVGPYHNANFDSMLISYLIPLYNKNVLVGVVGMDIDFDEVISDIEQIKCYKSGYACLVNGDGSLLYNPEYDKVKQTGIMEKWQETIFLEEDNGDEPIDYLLGDTRKQMAFRTLRNGMKIVITAQENEIYEFPNRLIRQIVITTILIFLSFIFITLVFSNKVTRPLKELVNVAREINEGRLEVTFPKETKDEVGELTHALEKMVHHLKHHIDDLNSLAYHDSLTGVKNKTAYDDAASKLDSIKGEKEYGLIVFDANNLKKINDTYGHERGNIYLQNACKLTCRIFKGSPVFRVGGDEFVVILQGDDYDNCYKLMRDFDIEAERINSETVNEWEKINIAKGLVKYDPSTDANVESVFKRADARMYVSKQKMKLAEGI